MNEEPLEPVPEDTLELSPGREALIAAMRHAKDFEKIDGD